MSEARTQIIEATTRMAVFTDGQRWDDLPGVFTPLVQLDYSALFGWDAIEISAAEVATPRWETGDRSVLSASS